MTPDSLIEVSYAKGESDILFARIHNGLTTLHLKSFWGNSFYTNLGVGSRSLGYSFDFPTIDGQGQITGFSEAYKIDNSVLGVDFSIGNRWQWETFTIGCDWVGTFVPLSTSGKTTVKNKSNFAADDIQDANDG